jgi:methionyl-tRNA synthetase
VLCGAGLGSRLGASGASSAQEGRVNRPSTAREALIVEALGDVAALIDRVEAATATMETTRQALVQATADLAAQALAFDNRMAAIAENAKRKAVQHIAQRTDELSRSTLAVQRQAFEVTAQELFRAEMESTLERVSVLLRQSAQRLDRSWQRWLTHAATATAASAVTWALAAWLWLR